MPDNKPNPNSGAGENEPSLSDLISKAKENIVSTDSPTELPKPDVSQAAAAPTKESSDKPDISFKKSEKSTNGTNNTARKRPNTDFSNKKNNANGGNRQNRPRNPQNANARKRPSGQQGTRGANTAQGTAQGANRRPSTAARRPVNSTNITNSATNGRRMPTDAVQKNIKKNQPQKNISEQAASKKAFDKKLTDKKKADNISQTEITAAVDTADSPDSTDTNGKKKFSFSKKQLLTVGGLIAALLLVLILVVLLLFNHYFSLFGGKQKKISNSEALTYSDVDLSRADTIDKVSEDEKLKQLLAEGEKISNDNVMNILLIGEDLRDTATDGAGNTDVMMIISVNKVDKTITMTSVMRDCYVNFQSEDGTWYSTRINAAYWHGGVELTQQTIENYMNIKIDRYVLVNFNVFIDIVDTLGGIDLTITDEEANGYEDADPDGENTRGMQNPLDEQNKYLGNKKGTDYLESGGKVHLNGNQALAYARLRYVGNSDYERTERQRKVITQMIKKSRKLSLVEMDALANEIFPQIKTDITKKEAALLLVEMLDYRNYTIQEFRVPADGTFTNQIISGMDVLSVDFTANAQLFRELVYGSIELDEEGNEEKQTIE